jgi:regulator of replication initiation timing
MSSQVQAPDQAIHLQQTITQLQTLAKTIADLIERNKVLERENENLQSELNEWHALVPQIKATSELAQANQEESIMIQKELNAIFTEREGMMKQLLSALEKENRTHGKSCKLQVMNSY